MPVLRAGVSPGDSVAWFGLEEGVSYAQVVKGTKLQKSFTVAVAFSNSKMSKRPRPGLAVGPHSCIEIAHDNELIEFWKLLNEGPQLAVEFLLCFFGGRECWSIRTDKV